MEARVESPIRFAVEMQGMMVDQHEEKLSATRHVGEGLSAEVMELTAQLRNL